MKASCFCAMGPRVWGWVGPLRYSHSPAELIDTRDFDALGKIVEVLARKW